MTTTAEAPKSGILRFFSNHPVVGLIGCLGSIASLIGLPFTIWPITPHRKLTYCFNPVRTAIVQTRRLSDITVNYRGMTVTGDVTAAHVAIWNAGREPIRAEDVLKTITVTLSNGCQILDAAILKAPRDVTGFALDRNQFHNGRVGLSWKIFEHNDAALIQILYAGTSGAGVSLDGVIIGQPEPAEITHPASMRTVRLMRSLSMVLNVIFGLLVGAVVVIWRARPNSLKLSRPLVACLIAVGLVILVVCAAQLALNVVISRSSMPFGVWLTS